MRKGVFGATLTVGLLAGTTAIAAICESAQDRHAFHVRALQTNLMVAALACDARSDYNGFVRKFEKQLIKHGRALKRQFHTSYGKSVGEKRLNAYVTALANRTSAKSSRTRDRYCETANRTFSALQGLSAEKLVTFSMSRPAGNIDVPSTCVPDVQLVGDPQ